MRRGLKRHNVPDAIPVRLGRTDLPDEEGTETLTLLSVAVSRILGSTDLPDEEGTETIGADLVSVRLAGRTDLPDEEGTETHHGRGRADGSGGVAPISPMRRGLKPTRVFSAARNSRNSESHRISPMRRGLKPAASSAASRSPCRTNLPDEEGTETWRLAAAAALAQASHRSPR